MNKREIKLALRSNKPFRLRFGNRQLNIDKTDTLRLQRIRPELFELEKNDNIAAFTYVFIEDRSLHIVYIYGSSTNSIIGDKRILDVDFLDIDFNLS